MSFIINKPHKIPRVNLSYDIMLGNIPKHIFDTKISNINVDTRFELFK